MQWTGSALKKNQDNVPNPCLQLICLGSTAPVSSFALLGGGTPYPTDPEALETNGLSIVFPVSIVS